MSECQQVGAQLAAVFPAWRNEGEITDWKARRRNDPVKPKLKIVVFHGPTMMWQWSVEGPGYVYAEGRYIKTEAAARKMAKAAKALLEENAAHIGHDDEQ